MKELSRVTIIISGKVQKVGFRFFARQLAEEHSVKGFVRNNSNGTLEIVAEAHKTQLDSFIDTVCAGPPSSEITKCETVWSDPTDEFLGFEIL